MVSASKMELDAAPRGCWWTRDPQAIISFWSISLCGGTLRGWGASGPRMW